MATPIRFYRRLKDMTQCELARAVGISQPTLHRYEQGLFPAPEDTLTKIAQILRINRKLLVTAPPQHEITEGATHAP